MIDDKWTDSKRELNPLVTLHVLIILCVGLILIANLRLNCENRVLPKKKMGIHKRDLERSLSQLPDKATNAGITTNKKVKKSRDIPFIIDT